MNEMTPIGTAGAASTMQVIRPQTFDELVRFAKLAADSTLVPKDYVGKPQNVFLAVQMGSEIGLSPMQAIQSIAVINGRPTLWGDAMLALCKASPLCENVSERIGGEGDQRRAWCIVKRRGMDPVEVSFCVADAKRAKLWGKLGPWQDYPDRMLQMRARSFALRDAFPDVLKGLGSAEEVRDIPAGAFNGTTVEHVEPPPEPAPSVPPLAAVAPLEAERPDYPFATSRGGTIFHTASEFTERWRTLISDCVRRQQLDKLATAWAMNAAQLAAVAEHDPDAANEVREMVEEHLDAATEGAGPLPAEAPAVDPIELELPY